MDFKGTRGKWKHKKGKRAKFEYDNFIIDEYGNHILKWSNTGNGSHKLTIKESHANGLLISKAPEMLEKLSEIVNILDIKCTDGCVNKTWRDFQNGNGEDVGLEIDKFIKDTKQLIKEVTEL